jgi:hypothetical protein
VKTEAAAADFQLRAPSSRSLKLTSAVVKWHLN